jgi:hypothetical protein
VTASAKRWLLTTAAYGCLMLAIALARLPGAAASLCAVAIWVALGYTLRSYAAAMFVLVVPLWDGIRGTSSGDVGPDWHLDLVIVVPLGALIVAGGVWLGRSRQGRIRPTGN